MPKREGITDAAYSGFVMTICHIPVIEVELSGSSQLRIDPLQRLGQDIGAICLQNTSVRHAS